MLLVGLGISMISCIYNLCKQNEEIIGGLIETMDSNEKNLFIGNSESKLSAENQKTDDTESIISNL